MLLDAGKNSPPNRSLPGPPPRCPRPITGLAAPTAAVASAAAPPPVAGAYLPGQKRRRHSLPGPGDDGNIGMGRNRQRGSSARVNRVERNHALAGVADTRVQKLGETSAIAGKDEELSEDSGEPTALPGPDPPLTYLVGPSHGAGNMEHRSPPLLPSRFCYGLSFISFLFETTLSRGEEVHASKSRSGAPRCRVPHT